MTPLVIQNFQALDRAITLSVRNCERAVYNALNGKDRDTVRIPSLSSENTALNFSKNVLVLARMIYLMLYFYSHRLFIDVILHRLRDMEPSIGCSLTDAFSAWLFEQRADIGVLGSGWTLKSCRLVQIWV